MSGNFASILDKPIDEIRRPPPLPIGTYHVVLRGQPRYDKSSKKQTPFVEFTAVPQATLDDVDPDLLAEALTNESTGEVRRLADVSFPITFYYEANGQAARLKEFLIKCGIAESGNLRAMIDESPNAEVLVTLKHEPSLNDPNSVQARPSSFAPVE